MFSRVCALNCYKYKRKQIYFSSLFVSGLNLKSMLPLYTPQNGNKTKYIPRLMSSVLLARDERFVYASLAFVSWPGDTRRDLRKKKIWWWAPLAVCVGVFCGSLTEETLAIEKRRWEGCCLWWCWVGEHSLNTSKWNSLYSKTWEINAWFHLTIVMIL